MRFRKGTRKKPHRLRSSRKSVLLKSNGSHESECYLGYKPNPTIRKYARQTSCLAPLHPCQELLVSSDDPFQIRRRYQFQLLRNSKYFSAKIKTISGPYSETLPLTTCHAASMSMRGVARWRSGPDKSLCFYLSRFKLCLIIIHLKRCGGRKKTIDGMHTYHRNSEDTITTVEW